MGTDQYTFQDPVKRYPSISPPKQDQPEPGLDKELEPQTDRGEQSYRGTGRLQGRKALIEAEGRTAVAIPGDVTDSEYCRELVQKAVDGLGGLDILVNNAGRQIAVEKLEDISDEQFDRTFKTNIYAFFWITKAALPHLKPGSSIINTTSIQAYMPSKDLIDYAATKAAINNFTKGLAQQLAPRGIRVNAVAPGPFWTPLQVSSGQPKEALPEFGQSTPIGRAGQPTELAPAYVFLASSESSYVMGETLNVNGGSPTP
jgi:NAD(P)-dependent dehydrogenase (short-subunit alcohol dehydrogenase family)